LKDAFPGVHNAPFVIHHKNGFHLGLLRGCVRPWRRIVARYPRYFILAEQRRQGGTAESLGNRL
jgi:hypothetical protein